MRFIRTLTIVICISLSGCAIDKEIAKFDDANYFGMTYEQHHQKIDEKRYRIWVRGKWDIPKAKMTQYLVSEADKLAKEHKARSYKLHDFEEEVRFKTYKNLVHRRGMYRHDEMKDTVYRKEVKQYGQPIYSATILLR